MSSTLTVSVNFGLEEVALINVITLPSLLTKMIFNTQVFARYFARSTRLIIVFFCQRSIPLITNTGMQPCLDWYFLAAFSSCSRTYCSTVICRNLVVLRITVPAQVRKEQIDGRCWFLDHHPNSWDFALNVLEQILRRSASLRTYFCIFSLSATSFQCPKGQWLYPMNLWPLRTFCPLNFLGMQGYTSAFNSSSKSGPSILRVDRKLNGFDPSSNFVRTGVSSLWLD